MLSRAAGGGQQWWSVGVGGVRYVVAGWGGRGYLFILRLTFCSNILLLLSALTSQTFFIISIYYVISSKIEIYMENYHINTELFAGMLFYWFYFGLIC